MISTINSAEYTENVVTQGTSETDYTNVKNTTLYYIPKEISILSSSTNTQLDTTTPIAKNDNIILIENGSDIHKYSIENDVNITSKNSTDILDIFHDDSCVACYQLDGDATDLSGNYNGTWSGIEQYDTGKFDQAAKFNGSDNHISIGNDNFGKTITVSVWIYRENDNEYGVVAGFSNNDVLIGFRACNNDTIIWTYKGDDYHTSNNAGVIPLHEWHHVVYSYDNGNVKIYIDNELKINESITVSQMGNNDGNCIGTSLFQSADNNHFSGLLDQVRIFNRTLTAEEVNALYDEHIDIYSADITNAGLSTTPTHAFFNQAHPIVKIAVEDNVSNITSSSFQTLTENEFIFDTDKFKIKYDDLNKTGRVIQRKIIAPNINTKIIEPFSSQVYKEV